jgi:signal transduction histidine kinase
MRESDRAVRLIDDLVDATRIDAGHLELNQREFELVTLVQSAVEQQHVLTPDHPIRTDVPDRPVIGVWDRDRILQVVENLLSNAVKYSPPGGEIVVRVAADAEHATVSVQDAGIGIPPEAMAQLFGRFYRAPNARQSSAKGIGLGLYISRALVTAHRGTLWADSAPGAGATFTFTLPLFPMT